VSSLSRVTNVKNILEVIGIKELSYILMCDIL